MKFYYDLESDCLYVYFNTFLEYAYSKEIDDITCVDYASDGTVVGIELLNLRNRIIFN